MMKTALKLAAAILILSSNSFALQAETQSYAADGNILDAVHDSHTGSYAFNSSLSYQKFGGISSDSYADGPEQQEAAASAAQAPQSSGGSSQAAPVISGAPIKAPLPAPQNNTAPPVPQITQRDLVIRITNENGVGLEGAAIRLDGRSATTDIRGFAVFPHETIGTAYTLAVSKSGYESIETGITVPAEGTVSFSLSSSGQTVPLQAPVSIIGVLLIAAFVYFLRSRRMRMRASNNHSNLGNSNISNVKPKTTTNF